MAYQFQLTKSQVGTRDAEKRRPVNVGDGLDWKVKTDAGETERGNAPNVGQLRNSGETMESTNCVKDVGQKQ